MKIVYSKIIPFKGFSAINLFGCFIIRAEYRDYFSRSPKMYKKMLRHETTHTYQMKELWYIGFYLMYFIEWIIRFVTHAINKGGRTWNKVFKDSYDNISFERDARACENGRKYVKYNWFKIMFGLC